MSDPGKSRPPLTRREIREREEAARRAAAGQRSPATGQPPVQPPDRSASAYGRFAPAASDSSAAVPGSPLSQSQAASPGAPHGAHAARGAHVAPASAAASPASASAPQIRSELPQARHEPPTRRSMHQSQPTGGSTEALQHNTVRPPTGSSGMRSLDETGRLTPVQRTAEQVVIRPVTPPVRQSSVRPASHQGTPGTPPPARPQHTGASGGVGASHREYMPGQTPAQTPVQPEAPRLSAFAAPAGQDAGSPAPFAPTSTPEQGIAQTPSWGSAPESAGGPGAAAQSPFEPINDSEKDQESVDALFPITPAGAKSAKRAAKKAERPQRPQGHSFAWLRYLILIVVTFVLGVLVYQLVLGDQSPLGLAPNTDSVVVQADPPTPSNGVL